MSEIVRTPSAGKVELPLPLAGKGRGGGTSDLFIERYVADFVCHSAKLVIGLDGGQHFSDQAERADAARSAELEVKGFKILRFSNYDVMTNRSGVLETISAALAERTPTLTLPRKRGREQADLPHKGGGSKNTRGSQP